LFLRRDVPMATTVNCSTLRMSSKTWYKEAKECLKIKLNSGLTTQKTREL
jgi:hypothetical protein